MKSPARDRIISAAQYLREHGFADVAAFLLAKEKREAHKSGKRKQVLFTERGEKVELYQETVKKLTEKQ